MAPVCTGCTPLGYAIGDSIKSYESAAPNAADAQMPCQAVRAQVVVEGKTGTVTGRLITVRPTSVVIEMHSGAREIMDHQITRFECERGSYWLEGTLIGLFADAAALTAFALTSGVPFLSSPSH